MPLASLKTLWKPLFLQPWKTSPKTSHLNRIKLRFRPHTLGFLSRERATLKY